LRDEVVPDRSGTVNGNGIESHSEDTVEGGVDESVSGLFHGFGEVLVLDVESSNIHSVLADETGQRPGSILDGKISSVRHVGGRLRTVIFVMSLASFVGLRAFGRRDPQVRGTSVEEDQEILWRGSNGNGTIVGEIILIGQRNGRSSTLSVFGLQIGVGVLVILSGELGSNQWDPGGEGGLEDEGHHHENEESRGFGEHVA